MDLQGKVCLVTGGTSGIGAATTLALARRGAQVVTISRKGDAQMPAALFSEFKTHGESIRFLLADVADPAACRHGVDEVAKDLGRLDVLVHSAGGPVPGSLDAVTEESWMNAFAVHVDRKSVV